MSLLGRAVDLYGYVFHPSVVIGLGVLLLIHYEWAGQSADRSVIWTRWGAFLAAGVLGFVPTGAFFALQRGTLSRAFSGSSWQLDMMVASGVVLGAAMTWAVWRRYDWGQLVPGGMAALTAVVPPYAILSPFWDISGHVIFALAPTLYLALLDRKFLSLLAIPVVMVPTRVLVNAHSALEAVAGFVVAAAIVVAVYRRSRPSASGSSETAALSNHLTPRRFTSGGLRGASARRRRRPRSERDSGPRDLPPATAGPRPRSQRVGDSLAGVQPVPERRV